MFQLQSIQNTLETFYTTPLSKIILLHPHMTEEEIFGQLSVVLMKKEFFDPDPDITAADTDQALSEEQAYLETVREIRSFMGWTHIPEMDNVSSSADDNLF